jgi:hypothetical protein
MRQNYHWTDARAGAFTQASQLLALFAAAAFLLSLTVMSAGAQQLDETDFSADELKAFAVASLKVEDLSEKWIPRIDKVQGTAEEREVRQSAANEMTAAVQSEGLSVDKYNEIYHASQINAEVAEEIDQHRQDVQ